MSGGRGEAGQASSDVPRAGAGSSDPRGMNSPGAASQRTASRSALWLWLVAVVVLAAGIGLRDPWPSDEPRYVLAARQMVESGEWLFPHRGIELYADKPPMLMWAQAAAYTVVRDWRIAFLLPSLLAALGSLWLTFDLGRRLWSPRVGAYAAIGTLAALQFAFQMKRAQIDPLLTLWITLSLWGLLRHCLQGPQWRWYWLGCFAAGLGVITKGVGVIALLVLVPYAVMRWRGWSSVYRDAARGDAWRWAAGGVAFVAAIALWVVPMLLAASARAAPEYAAYVDDILFRQTATRYARSWGHLQPFWYFVPVLLLQWFPLSLAYAGTVPRWWDDWRAREARIALPLAWIVLVLIFFSIPAGKRDVYVMPAVPMMALCIAPYIDELLALRWLRRTALVAAVLMGVALVVAGLWAMSGASRAALRAAERYELANGGETLWWMLVAVGAVFLTAAIVLRMRGGVVALLAGLASLWIAWGLWATPLLNASSSAARVMTRAGEIVGPDAEIGLVAWKEQNLLMADRPMTDFGFKQPVATQFARGAAWVAQAPARRWLFAQEIALGECVLRERAVRVGVANRRTWWLVPAPALVPGCALAADAPNDIGGDDEDDGP